MEVKNSNDIHNTTSIFRYAFVWDNTIVHHHVHLIKTKYIRGLLQKRRNLVGLCTGTLFWDKWLQLTERSANGLQWLDDGNT